MFLPNNMTQCLHAVKCVYESIITNNAFLAFMMGNICNPCFHRNIKENLPLCLKAMCVQIIPFKKFPLLRAVFISVLIAFLQEDTFPAQYAHHRAFSSSGSRFQAEADGSLLQPLIWAAEITTAGRRLSCCNNICFKILSATHVHVLLGHDPFLCFQQR